MNEEIWREDGMWKCRILQDEGGSNWTRTHMIFQAKDA